jgi:DNA-binding transcriptional regulator YdaS (Cro superfamily)
MLQSIDEVLDALGGPARVAQLCGVGPSAVSNWKARGRIPAEKFMIFLAELEVLGKKVEPRLFGFDVRPAEVRV